MDQITELSVALDAAADDVIRPFAVPALNLRGRVARLGALTDTVVARHAYPRPVARLVGEALALTALLGSALKFDGRFVLQLQGDGPVSLLVADYVNAGDLRAYCRFDADRLENMSGAERLFGSGHLAFTIDQGAAMQNYQGIVSLEGDGLTEVAEAYFRQSEQIPTRLVLAAGELVRPGQEGTQWRSGGLFVQHLPAGESAETFGAIAEGSAGPHDEDAWREATALVDTVESDELIDANIATDRVLYRLFHERGVRVFEAHRLNERCRCSAQRVEAMIGQFTAAEIDDMTVDGEIGVTCEFCGRDYRFDPVRFSD